VELWARRPPHRLTVIEDGVPIERAMQRLALPRQDLDHAVRIQKATRSMRCRRESWSSAASSCSAQAGGAGATKDDVAKLLTRLAVEARLGTSERRP
ncbi:MAG: hypothetical protein M3071_15845, partial [Actinomycetota bacterium]|nr:hypothetical protein [Actinomycetota bacterium]